ncbi:MAG: UDP-N-acetylmuramoyl-L-alanyl-D-glutamate--2,6-diaminopimelate ligase [Clostridiales bacterium]|nr:UDP-N-acetylmuramoyl-L-alanyl-D-glutamate--2,6-diaminopimelate ligase [Clostridiales bacterium]
MKLSKIIQGLKCKSIQNFQDYNIECLSHYSKDVVAGSVFFCINGGNENGAKYIEEAIKNGAVVLVVEDNVSIENICVICVDNVRVAMSIIAKNFYGKCDEKLQKIAVVGTNGKTTTSHIIASILKENDKKVGVIGTNGIYIGNERLPSSFTTPDPIELHYTFSQMVSFGVEIVVMEVSAHAIYYDKIYGIFFDVGVFTNISNEHLDFFHDMDNYSRVKMSIFNKKYMKEFVVNTDDEYGIKLAKSSTIPAVSYGINNPCNVFAVNIKMSINGSDFYVNVNDDIIHIKTHLLGEYNVYNILASISVAKLLGVSNAVIEKGLKNLPQIDGRFMVYKTSQNKRIIIDFAHTPDGFEKVLGLVKKLRKGKLTVLFGCVGYSDAVKRTLMGKIASEYADKLVVTTDNIGNADFDQVYSDIVLGVDGGVEVIKEYDRAKAIADAYKAMTNNETLVLLGKGTEDKQVIKNECVPYSDVLVVEGLLGGNNANIT